MKTKNNRFAEALDELKRNHGIKTQKDLASLMGVNQNTVTRILKGYTEVTEDIITKLQTASGCIFNLQWLRGEDTPYMLAEQIPTPEPQPAIQSNIDPSSAINAALAVYVQYVDTLKANELKKDEQIADLRQQLSDKDEIIKLLRHRVAELEKTISERNQDDIAKYPFTMGASEDPRKSKKSQK